MKKSISKPVSNKKAASIGESIKDIVEEIYLEKSKLGRIIGVGLSVSGIVSPTKQKIIYSGTMGWHNIHISDLFPPMEELTVVVENDANAAILGELWLKNISDQQDAVYIIIGGSAIGASLLINGELVRGSNLVAGEISHFPVAENGKKCACGKRGCFETYVSLGRLQQDYEELSGRSSYLIEAYKSGDKIAVKLVVEAARKLAKVILASMYLVNPEKIIIGGLWLEAGDEFLELVRNTVKAEFSLAEGLIPKIAYSSLHPRAGVLGAVGLVINEFLSYQ
ncbi:MAG TPA: ROK family protein [Firmicutes bacterium]|nr:ROK family protein [Bacillota bacterium]